MSSHIFMILFNEAALLVCYLSEPILVFWSSHIWSGQSTGRLYIHNTTQKNECNAYSGLTVTDRVHIKSYSQFNYSHNFTTKTQPQELITVVELVKKSVAK
jgi:hypothetical protein